MTSGLFCGGPGTRMRDDPDWRQANPVASDALLQPIRPQGLRLVPRRQGKCRQEFFLNYRPQPYADCIVSGFGDNVEIKWSDRAVD
jgi:glucose-1-phosphate cytidylyltransferase